MWCLKEVILEELIVGVATHEVNAARGENDEERGIDSLFVESLDETLCKPRSHQLIEFKVVFLLLVG
jgi:hypothetical protein